MLAAAYIAEALLANGATRRTIGSAPRNAM